jgi:hypothetical protein
MQFLNSATVPELKRLMDLFPAANIRANWPSLKGHKDDLCKAIAEQHDLAAIAKFTDENLSCCKQHVYIFSHGNDLKTLPDSVVGGEGVVSVVEKHTTYVIRTQYKVYLSDPVTEAILDFLWPVRLDLLPKRLIVRFVVLERDLASHFKKEYHLGGRTVDEDGVLAELKTDGLLAATDLHKGIKKLWADDFMDCHKAKYKKPKSVASEAMDNEEGIKKNNPELYKVLQKSVLLSAVFQVGDDQKTTVSAFSSEPPLGFLSFTRYTEKRGDTDIVIQKILASN